MIHTDIKLNWLFSEQLLQEDASLSLGWIEIKTQNKDFLLFEKKLCMLFLTLSDLLEFLSNDNRNFNWVGVDGSDIYSLTKYREILIIQKEGEKFILDYTSFRESIIKTSTNLINYLLKNNLRVKEESAFIDLSNCLENLICK
uniref:hypothetical protein n=1 Tax=Psychrobacter sp. TaxID=56811 RepID=UPI0015976D5A|nr:hypothetical protein [Psychrobacter sp.]QJS05088.1 hypothetical protein [Psychrobacter sp.]